MATFYKSSANQGCPIIQKQIFPQPYHAQTKSFHILFSNFSWLRSAFQGFELEDVLISPIWGFKMNLSLYLKVLNCILIWFTYNFT